MFTHHDGYDIFYDTLGDPSGAPLLMVNGFTSQCVTWPDALLSQFAAAGFFVIVHDNRDVGLSTKSAPGQHYLLRDMAADSVAVLDALGVERAHLWGCSMGGMIVQTLAIEHPHRTSSLCSVMSTTGDRTVGNGTAEALDVLMTPPPEGRDGVIAQAVANARVIGGPLSDDDWEAERARRSYDRCFWPQGAAHQMRAIMHSGDRTEALGGVRVPTTVIHGRVDPLITLSGGEATAAAVPGAKLVVLDEMGHNLPTEYFDDYVAELVALRAAAHA